MQLRTVLLNPGMNIRAVYATGCAHIGNHTEKFAGFQYSNSFSAGLSTHSRVAIAFQSGADVGHDCRLVFNEQDRQRGRLGGRQCHDCITPATTPSGAGSDEAGRRTMKVAPSSATLL